MSSDTKPPLSALPPTYDEATASDANLEHSNSQPRSMLIIPRKPLSSAVRPPSHTALSSESAQLPLRDESGMITSDISSVQLDQESSAAAVLRTHSLPPVHSQAVIGQLEHASTAPIAATPIATSEAKAKTLSALRSGFEEARHFAGGLMHHPVESTKHFSILRHTLGLVYYRGTSTSIALSIFSDQRLPKGRTLWLQPKGWTGHTGLKVKALVRSTNDWTDVTPCNQVQVSQLPPSDERAWQRDIKQFTRKAEGNASKHKLRETVVIRIPVDVQDGYWRVVLCDEKKRSLCPSPVFRVASASGSPGSLRGASLGNLPLEIGANIISQLGAAHVQGIISPISETVTSTIQSAMPYQPGAIVQEAGTMAANEAYTRSGTQERIVAANSAYDAAREATYASVTGGDDLDSGPQHAFPVSLSSKVIAGTGRASATLGMPTANLRSIPDDVSHKLCGFYFGWSRITFPPNASSQESAWGKDHLAWHPSVIYILPDAYKASSVVANVHKTASVFLIHDFESASFFDATIDVRILGFIRPYMPPKASAETGYDEPTADDVLLAAVEDVAFTQSMLEREGWGPDAGVKQGDRNWTKQYVSTRTNVMRQIDRVPTAQVGIRTARDTLKDRAVGTGGVFVVRD